MTFWGYLTSGQFILLRYSRSKRLKFKTNRLNQSHPKPKMFVYKYPGWLYHRCASLGEAAGRARAAVWCLQRAVGAEPDSGAGLYLLGRCYAAQGKVHDAFIAYRNSVEKSEGNADTWCSIGWVEGLWFVLPTWKSVLNFDSVTNFLNIKITQGIISCMGCLANHRYLCNFTKRYVLSLKALTKAPHMVC